MGVGATTRPAGNVGKLMVQFELKLKLLALLLERVNVKVEIDPVVMLDGEKLCVSVGYCSTFKVTEPEAKELLTPSAVFRLDAGT